MEQRSLGLAGACSCKSTYSLLAMCTHRELLALSPVDETHPLYEYSQPLKNDYPPLDKQPRDQYTDL
jgi:hypothetical protein